MRGEAGRGKGKKKGKENEGGIRREDSANISLPRLEAMASNSIAMA